LRLHRYQKLHVSFIIFVCCCIFFLFILYNLFFFNFLYVSIFSLLCFVFDNVFFYVYFLQEVYAKKNLNSKFVGVGFQVLNVVAFPNDIIDEFLMLWLLQMILLIIVLIMFLHCVRYNKKLCLRRRKKIHCENVNKTFWFHKA
jgi:hypothetical protein